ncbi:hypothetical protein [Maricaulis sp.]|uniref:hypothetical protein n=1 Tax=Maricaulis sp. TaxID=1486257 RepID=UPI0026271B52|nr:hypothetical protein [Maricaulis sp.]
MSGLVAKRLFAFLPPRMPIRTKYQLAGNVWRHFGPSSRNYFRVGPDTPQQLVLNEVLARLDAVVTPYNTPQNVQRRFDWLAGADVELQEKLLNHFREEEKKLALEKISLELPMLQNQVREHPDTTAVARSTLQVNKHEIQIRVEAQLLDQFKEGAPDQSRFSPRASTDSNWGLIFFVGFIVLAILASMGAFD